MSLGYLKRLQLQIIWLEIVFFSNLDIVKKVQKLKPEINEQNRLKRLEFVHKWLKFDNNNFSHKLGLVLWSDEMTVKQYSNSKTMHVWCDADKHPGYNTRKQQGGLSVMFWGFFSERGRGCLRVVEGNMDAKQYLTILKKDFIAEAQDLRSKGISCRLMQDGAGVHRAKIVTQFINNCGYEFLVWPPISPDLNPIENIWGWLKRDLYVNYPTPQTRKDLIDFVCEIWEKITPEMCRAYCSNYEKRLLACLEANGLQTKY